MHHIVLSPHYDDAALSCGGLIARLAAGGESVTVLTIFGGQPDLVELSPFARSIHQRPDAHGDLLAQRMAEERCALDVLGAQGEVWPHLDCIYRREQPNGRWLYDHEEALFGPVDPADSGLIARLAGDLTRVAATWPASTIYAPLGIGQHVDHQIVHQAGQHLGRTGLPVRYYEDYPYVVRDPMALERTLDRLADGDGWGQQLVALNEPDLRAKIDAVCCYASQLAVLFDANADTICDSVAHALEGFASATAAQSGGGRWAERLWLAGDMI